MIQRLSPVVLAVCLAVAGPAVAQDRAETLAQIRQELTVLSVEMQRLRSELAQPETDLPEPATEAALQRLDTMEGELRRLTAAAEELQFRIERIVEDGTNRISDLEFRLTELEGGDLSQIDQTRPLGADPDAAPATPAPRPAPGVQLAVGETADFEAALGLLETGTPADALTSLDRFVENYPRSPLAAEAQFYRGEALNLLGNPQEAGRAFLESYTLSEDNNPGLAGEALFHLGSALNALGEMREACLTLGQVSVRFPGTAAVAKAEQSLAGMTCP